MTSMRYRLLFGSCLMAMASTVVNAQEKAPTTAEAKDDAKPQAAPNPKEMVEQAIKAIDQTEYDKARKLLERADALAPTLDVLGLAKGMMLARAQHGREALGMLEHYNRSETGKRDYRGYWEAGKLYRQSKAPRGAEDALKEAYELAPSLSENDVAGVPIRARIAIDLADVYLDLDREEEALRLAREALDMAPRNPGLQFLYGSISWKAKPGAWKDAVRAVKEAARLFSELLASNPFNPERLSMLRGCYSLEIEIYSKVHELNKKDFEVVFNGAQAIREAASVDLHLSLLRARELGLNALEAEPDNADRALFVAGIEIDMGVSELPLERIEKVLQKQPDHPGAKVLRERALALKAFHEPGKPDEEQKPTN